MILLCVVTSLSLANEISSKELEMEVALLIASMTERLSEISIVLGHEYFNHSASLTG